MLVTADYLSYKGETELATYSGSAHLWQGETEFHGEQIVLDESTGISTLKVKSEPAPC